MVQAGNAERSKQTPEDGINAEKSDYKVSYGKDGPAVHERAALQSPIRYEKEIRHFAHEDYCAEADYHERAAMHANLPFHQSAWVHEQVPQEPYQAENQCEIQQTVNTVEFVCDLRRLRGIAFVQVNSLNSQHSLRVLAPFNSNKLT